MPTTHSSVGLNLSSLFSGRAPLCSATQSERTSQCVEPSGVVAAEPVRLLSEPGDGPAVRLVGF